MAANNDISSQQENVVYLRSCAIAQVADDGPSALLIRGSGVRIPPGALQKCRVPAVQTPGSTRLGPASPFSISRPSYVLTLGQYPGLAKMSAPLLSCGYQSV